MTAFTCAIFESLKHFILNEKAHGRRHGDVGTPPPRRFEIMEGTYLPEIAFFKENFLNLSFFNFSIFPKKKERNPRRSQIWEQVGLTH